MIEIGMFSSILDLSKLNFPSFGANLPNLAILVQIGQIWQFWWVWRR
jgi:hypothetical protein